MRVPLIIMTTSAFILGLTCFTILYYLLGSCVCAIARDLRVRSWCACMLDHDVSKWTEPPVETAHGGVRATSEPLARRCNYSNMISRGKPSIQHHCNAFKKLILMKNSRMRTLLTYVVKAMLKRFCISLCRRSVASKTDA